MRSASHAEKPAIRSEATDVPLKKLRVATAFTRRICVSIQPAHASRTTSNGRYSLDDRPLGDVVREAQNNSDESDWFSDMDESARDTVNGPNGSDPPKRLRVSVGAFGLAILAGGFLFTGRAYRLSYYAHLHLNGSVFPDDAQARSFDAVIAWGDVVTSLISLISRTVARHHLGMVLGPTLGLLLFVVTLAVIRDAPRWTIWRKVSPAGKRRRMTGLIALLRGPGRMVLAFLRWIAPPKEKFRLVERFYQAMLGLYGAYVFLVLVGLVFVALVLPFQHAGEDAASRDAKDGFSGQPDVALVLDGKAASSFKLVECGADFCALFGGGHAITVPKDQIKLAVSAPPGDAPKAVAAANDHTVSRASSD